jgi:hypothetical protein
VGLAAATPAQRCKDCRRVGLSNRAPAWARSRLLAMHVSLLRRARSRQCSLGQCRTRPSTGICGRIRPSQCRWRARTSSWVGRPGDAHHAVDSLGTVKRTWIPDLDACGPPRRRRSGVSPTFRSRSSRTMVESVRLRASLHGRALRSAESEERRPDTFGEPPRDRASPMADPVRSLSCEGRGLPDAAPAGSRASFHGDNRGIRAEGVGTGPGCSTCVSAGQMPS